MKIIYQQTDGSVAVITPAANCSLTDAQTALKDVPSPIQIWDVPTGVMETDDDGNEYEVMGSRLHQFRFKIVEDSVVPSDRTFRNAWTVDEATLTDGVGA
jgi:hypothetical protein